MAISKHAYQKDITIIYTTFGLNTWIPAQGRRDITTFTHN